MGDDNKRALAVAQRVNAVGNNLQGVDIQPGVRLVQDAQLRFQHRHLQDIVALFLAAGEADVNRAGQQILRHLQQLNFVLHQVLEVKAVKLLLAAVAAHGVQRGLQEKLIADAGNFNRILKGHEDALAGAIFRGEFQQIFAFKLHAAAGHLIVFTSGKRGGERTFTGTVRAHNGMHFAGANVQIQSAQDLFVFNGDLQIFYT